MKHYIHKFLNPSFPISTFCNHPNSYPSPKPTAIPQPLTSPPTLSSHPLQTPPLINEYITEVRSHLQAVTDTESEDFPVEEKLAFIHETRHAFGRTALLLSGGAALGAFHLGVVRTLIEHRILPRVIAGASVGSIICSFAATRTWDELQVFFDDPFPPMHFFENMGSIVATANRLLTKGAIHEIGLLQRKMRQLIGDLTFQEAYDLSGKESKCARYLTVHDMKRP